MNLDQVGEDTLLCHCMRVELRQIRAAIRAGAKTVEDLNRMTTACGGCGSCRWDLEEVLAAAQKNSPPPAP